MIRISKLTDYSIIILSFLGNGSQKIWQTAEIAAKTNLAKPTVAKVLKRLANKKFVTSVRGKDGGYKIAIIPKEISLAMIITALEGQVAITECNSEDNCCSMTKHCPLTSPLTKINRIIYDTLDTYKLSDLITTYATTMGHKVKIMGVV